MQGIFQGKLHFGFRQQYPCVTFERRSFFGFARDGDFGGNSPPGLFGCLAGDALPAFSSLLGSGGEMAVGAAGEHWHDSTHSQLGAFLKLQLEPSRPDQRLVESDVCAWFHLVGALFAGLATGGDTVG